jgi:hypothetical protein
MSASFCVNSIHCLTWKAKESKAAGDRPLKWQHCYRHFVWFLFLAIVYHAATAQCEILTLEGEVSYTAYNGQLSPVKHVERRFSLRIFDSRWLYDVRGFPYGERVECGTDGSNIFVVHQYDSNTPRPDATYNRRKDGTPALELKDTKLRQTKNQASAVVYSALAPRFDMSLAAPVWLAYASRSVLASSNNGKVYPVWEIVNQHFAANVDAAWKMNESGFLSQMTFFRPDEKDYLRTNAVYHVASFTNVGAMRIPERFVLERFRTHSTNLLTRVEGHIQNVRWEADGAKAIPEMPPRTIVLDERLGINSRSIGLTYFSTNGIWLGTNEAERLRAAQEIHPLPPNDSGTHAKRMVVYFVLMLTLIIPLWLLIHNLKSKRK